MKARVREAVQSVQGIVGHVRTWFHPRLDADARPLEVREAILEHVEARVEPAGGGRRVLPGTQVSVAILVDSQDRRALLEAALAELDSAVRARLAELRCDVPAGFAVDVEYVARAKPEWEAGQWMAIELGQSSSDRPSPARIGPPLLHITVVCGTATQPAYTFSERHILIGRTADPVDHRGWTRQNQVVFLEDGDSCGRTVGRAHASIQYLVDRREYRLFDEGSRNGTRVVRDGAMLDVVPRDPVGVALRSGDEVRFGSAVVRVRVEPGQGNAGG